MKKNIIIDSSFLNIFNKTDITFKLDKQIKNVTELRLVSLKYPKKNYNISTLKKNNILTFRKFKSKISIKKVENISDNLQLTYDDNFSNTLKVFPVFSFNVTTRGVAPPPRFLRPYKQEYGAHRPLTLAMT